MDLSTNGTRARVHLRDAVPGDHADLLRLNASSVAMLSPLDAPALAALRGECDVARVAVDAGHVRGFVLALREGRAYGSANYRCFLERYPRFLYVDRVVVEAEQRGRGIAQRLYADVFAHAAARGIPFVACEYDLEPFNPASARFHLAQGFVEVGRQRLAGGKQVSMQVADVASAGFQAR